jgi:hypothetical protein
MKKPNDPPSKPASDNVTSRAGDADSHSKEQVAERDWGDLARRVTALEGSEKGFWRRAGMVLGILAGLVAIPKASYDLWTQTIHPRPSVKLSWRNDGALAYDPSEKHLTLVYNLSISNADGTAEDRINSGSVKLLPGGYVIGAPFIKFGVGQQKVAIPVTIGKGESKDVSVSVIVLPDLAKLFLADPGPKETDVAFTLESSKGFDHPLLKKFCLGELDSDDLQRVISGEQPWLPQNASCKD